MAEQKRNHPVGTNNRMTRHSTGSLLVPAPFLLHSEPSSNKPQQINRNQNQQQGGGKGDKNIVEVEKGGGKQTHDDQQNNNNTKYITKKGWEAIQAWIDTAAAMGNMKSRREIKAEIQKLARRELQQIKNEGGNENPIPVPTINRYMKEQLVLAEHLKISSTTIRRIDAGWDFRNFFKLAIVATAIMFDDPLHQTGLISGEDVFNVDAVTCWLNSDGTMNNEKFYCHPELKEQLKRTGKGLSRAGKKLGGVKIKIFVLGNCVGVVPTVILMLEGFNRNDEDIYKLPLPDLLGRGTVGYFWLVPAKYPGTSLMSQVMDVLLDKIMQHQALLVSDVDMKPDKRAVSNLSQMSVDPLPSTKSRSILWMDGEIAQIVAATSLKICSKADTYNIVLAKYSAACSGRQQLLDQGIGFVRLHFLTNTLFDTTAAKGTNILNVCAHVRVCL